MGDNGKFLFSLVTGLLVAVISFLAVLSDFLPAFICPFAIAVYVLYIVQLNR